ncbi:MAG: hypothetical protein GY794_25305, partial [bacterium]|nr:hypothetical protein [bacterium]
DALSGSVASHVFTVEDGQVDILFDDVKNAGAYFLSGLILNTASGQATNPFPADTATDVSTLANLSWDAGHAVSHDIYFGTDPTPDAGEFQGNNSGNTYAPTLSPNTTYYWRIDEANNNGTLTGDVWSFTTETVSKIVLDEVADLDLTNVVKAVHWSNNSTLGTPATDITIGGVTFLAGPFNGTVDGVTNAGNGFGAGVDWQVGPTTDDTGLDDILNSFIIGADNATITIPVPNGDYKLQLMFYDAFASATRGIDVTIEGALVFDDYFLTAEQGGDALSGSVASHVFTVTDG